MDNLDSYLEEFIDKIDEFKQARTNRGDDLYPGREKAFQDAQLKLRMAFKRVMAHLFVQFRID